MTADFLLSLDAERVSGEPCPDARFCEFCHEWQGWHALDCPNIPVEDPAVVQRDADEAAELVALDFIERRTP